MADAFEEVKIRLDSLKGKRDPWLDLWQELAEVYLPGQTSFTTKKMPGERTNEAIYDSTPRRAARELASAIDGLIKPKTANWFEPSFEDEEVLDNPEVKGWLEHVQGAMWRAIYSTDARFVQRSAEVDSALPIYGWGVLWIAENRARNGIIFKSFHNKDVAFDENGEGVIDTLAIDEDLTARQAIARFGAENVHPKIIEALESKNAQTNSQTFKFSQLIVPRYDFLANKIGGRAFPFKSITVDCSNKKIMKEGGFHEFPAAVPRWDTEADQCYPRSPAMVALPDALTLQAISKTLLIAGERSADPPLMVPSDGFLSPIRTHPGGVSVFDTQALTDGNLKTPVFPLPTSNALPVGREMQADYRFQVESSFYKEVLNLPAEGMQTATEVLERKEQFIRALGPIFGRLEADYIGTMTRRIFAIMERAQAFLPRPQIVAEMPVTFRYQSPLQQARKALDVAGLNRTLQVVAPLLASQPDLIDHIDADQIFRDSPEWSGIPSKWLKTEDEVAEVRGQRAEQQAAQEQMDSMQPVADAVKSVAQAQEATQGVEPQI
jgi:hypothetical protein